MPTISLGPGTNLSVIIFVISVCDDYQREEEMIALIWVSLMEDISNQSSS
jgi:hypothetical protein